MSIDATADGALLAIDFGTTTSSMAWYNPKKDQAEILKNAEGEEKTPSVVYFGAREVLVGTPAEHLIEDETERERVIWSIKRELATRRIIALPDRRVTPVDVVRAVLAKLKHDAEELHFHQSVSGLVLNDPAAFDVLEREALEQAERGAGFSEVRLLEEPIAAELAYAHEHEDADRNLLVDDLGGGTLDLAILTRDNSGFRLATEPRGLRLGGDDFDRALGDLVEAEVRRKLGQSFGGLDPFQLRQCRRRKEELSHREPVNVSLYVEGQRVSFTLHRAEFEARIRAQIETTVRLTRELVANAKGRGYPVETIVLIGGASRTPLVQQLLTEALSIKSRKWHHQDVAVGLGAAYHSSGNNGAQQVAAQGDRRFKAQSEKREDSIHRSTTGAHYPCTFRVVDTLEELEEISRQFDVLLFTSTAELGFGERIALREFRNLVYPSVDAIARPQSIVVCWSSFGCSWWRNKNTLTQEFKRRSLLFPGVFYLRSGSIIAYEKIGFFDTSEAILNAMKKLMHGLGGRN